MPEPIIDAPDKPDPPPDAGANIASDFGASTLTGSFDAPRPSEWGAEPKSSASDVSNLVSQITGLMPTPEQQEKMRTAHETQLLAQIRDRENFEREEKGYDDQYRSKMDQMLAAESWTGDEKPWDPKTMAPQPTSLWEKIGSPGFIFAMLAGSFSALPMNSALMGGAAAMNAINVGDMDAYEKSYTVWKDNIQLALKRHQQEHQEFEDIMSVWEKDHALARQRLEEHLNKYGDYGKLAMLRAGYDPDLMDAVAGQAKAAESLSKLIPEMEEQHALHMGITDELKAGKKPLEAYTNTLKKIQEAKSAVKLPGLTQSEAATVDQRASELKAEADAKGAPITEGQARIKAMAEVSEARGAGKGGGKAQLDQIAIMGRAQELQDKAKAEGKELPPYKAIEQAQSEHKRGAAGALEVTPEGDTKPPPEFSQQTWDMNSDIYRATGHLPTLGIGGTSIKQGLYAHALFREQEKGGSVGTMQARWATNKGLEKALSQAEVNNAAVEAFARNAELNSSALLGLAKKVDKTGVRVFERWRRAGGRAVTGDPDVTNFDAQVNIWRNEIAKLTTSPNLGGQITVHAQEEAKAYAGTDWTMDQIKGTVNLFRADGQRRKQSIEEEIGKLQNQIAGSLETTPGATAPAVPEADLGGPKIKSIERVQ
jgi:hypothetical protein